VSAGRSAQQERQRSQQRALQYARLAREELHRAACFGAAGESEARVAALLRPLTQLGWRLLEDRRWPGTRAGNVDLILVGPGGVLVTDVKSWRDVTVRGGD
jgi:hypothetical protein